MIRLRISPFTSIGVKETKDLPKEGDGIVKYIEKHIDAAIDELVESYDLTVIKNSLKIASRDHLKKSGEWPVYFSAKVVVTHDLDAHKLNVKKFNDITDKKWNQL